MLEIWYVALSCSLLPILFIEWVPDLKWSRPKGGSGGEGPDLESFKYIEHIQQSFSLEVFASDA